jgi:CubicO group peptidase (beta-lactamase class C family)
MTHSAGFGYGLSGSDPVNKAFRDQGVLRSQGLQQMIDKVATIPLLSQPGQAWRYSVAVDVQGYIVEKLSGQPLDVFMQERIFRPLKMTDTAFYVAPAKVGRLAAVYGVNPETGALIDVPASFAQDYTKPPAMISGGGGLVSTTSDYARFCQMILNDGVLDGARILSPASIASWGPITCRKARA